MMTVLWMIAGALGVGVMCYHRVSKLNVTVASTTALLFCTFVWGPSAWLLFPAWLTWTATMAFMHLGTYRKQFVTRPLLTSIRHTMPTVSATEQTALDAGDTWWEGQLFTGKPDWTKLWNIPNPKLSTEEQAFLDGPVEVACQMADDWDITQYRYDLPEALWSFLKAEGFFGLIIPKAHGGKEFSAIAHSAIVTKLASRSITLSTSVAVPNTLGPAELLLHYGTEEQKNYYLPRLACGQEIPCFGLTGPEAGSDASSIPDRGVVCHRLFEGKETLGIELNFDKRYITMAPIATVIGLAFQVSDPDQLLGSKEHLGITCALIPRETAGVKIGRRHLPATIPFQNGPIQGKNVFIPLDWVIGGPSMIGNGWRMLMECLSCGRAITLPSSSVGGAKFGVQATGAYASIRKQFKLPIGEFEGIKDVLARIAGFTYLCDATRLITVAGIEAGCKPAIASAISKYHVTELSRTIANDVMDIHAGKGVMMGPKNYIARGYQGSPISITVEGANILTRNLIIFSQGLIRCHPYLKAEIDAVGKDDLQAFDDLLVSHTGFVLQNIAGSLYHGLTRGRFAQHPTTCVPKLYQPYSQAIAAFALTVDFSAAVLGGNLKKRESLSARLGDMLSYLYMGTAALKHFADHGEPAEDVPLVSWCNDYALSQFYKALSELINNFPNKWIARALRVMTTPLGQPIHAPNDRLGHQVANLITRPTATRRRLINGMYDWQKPGSHAYNLEQALMDSLAAAPVEKKIAAAVRQGVVTEGDSDALILSAQKANVITAEEADIVSKAKASRRFIIAVDDFPAESLALKPANAPLNTTSESVLDNQSWLNN